MVGTKLARLIGIMGIGIVAQMAQGQAAGPPPQADPPPQSATTEAPAEPAQPAVPIGLVLAQNGGSLARAQLTRQPDPAISGAASVSYFAVPQPQAKLLKKHDLVTIIVREASTFASNGTTDLKHASDMDIVSNSQVQLNLKKLSLMELSPTTPLELQANANHNFNGQAQVERDDTLTAQITASVIDVKPNGTLVLQATEHIKTDEEEQQLVIVGTCRVEDVSADNTVLSTQLYDLSLNKTHTGAVRDTTERGFIPRLLDTINPF